MPFGSVGQIYIPMIWVIVAACLWYGDRASKLVGLALAVSSALAIAATILGAQWIMIIGLPISAGIAIAARTMASLVIAVLYAVRLFLFTAPLWGLFSVQSAWNINEVPLTLQLLIAVGTLAGGSGVRVHEHPVRRFFGKYSEILNRSF